MLSHLSNQSGVSSVPLTLNEFLTDQSLKRIERFHDNKSSEAQEIEPNVYFWNDKFVL